MTTHTSATVPEVGNDGLRRPGALRRVGDAIAPLAVGTIADGVAPFATTLLEATS